MERNSEVIVRPGDAVVESCKIYSSLNANPFDLTAIWMTLAVEETIGADYVSLEMSFTDNQNLIEKIPIITNERIIVKFKTDGAENFRTFSGRIVSIPTRADINQGTRGFAIKAISEEFIRNQKIKFSKSYKNTLISDMVLDIFNQYINPVSGKQIAIAPTLERESKIIPNYSPMRAINWLTKWARSPEYRRGASYVFFQNMDNFYFGPIERLMDTSRLESSIPRYTHSINVRGDDTKNKNLERGMFNIINYGTKSISHLEMIETGMLASSVLSHDLVLRSTAETNYNYFSSFGDNTHLEENPITNDIQSSNFKRSRFLLAPEHYSAFNDEINSNRTRQNALIRFSQLSQLKSNGLEIMVPGDSKRTIGEVVNVELPSIGPQARQETFAEGDKYLSSKYLIWSIRHEITRGPSGGSQYFCHMKLYRDSNRNKIPDQQAFPFGEV